MDPGGVLGAAKAGLPFDPVVFFKRPQVILRLISLLFSIIVFGCINSGCWEREKCIYGDDPNACAYGVGIGVIAFLAAIVFLILDAMFDQISNIKQRKYIIIGDMGFSGFWSFLWFVGFCYLTNKWNSSSEAELEKLGVEGWKYGNARGAIAFCFFSIPVWALLCYFGVQRFRLGLQGSFGPSDQIEQQVGGIPGGMDAGGASPYAAYPGVDSGDLAGGGMNTGTYNQQPFTGGAQPGQYGGGQPMTY